ncbi:MAG: WD40 repeat domain-containing protein [Flavobacteriales bacterium]|nr:WD40 repeat domain-containing protein [Flavobacteriales bacterium]
MLRKNFIVALALFAAEVHGQSLLWTASGHPEQRGVYGVAFSGNGQYVLSGSECPQARLRMFNGSTGSVTWEHQVSNSLLCTAGVKFSSNGQYMANAEETGNLQIFQVSGSVAELYTTITNNTGALYSVDFSPANDKVAVGAGSGRLIIYSLPTGAQLHNVIAHGGEVLGVSWSSDGQFIATSGGDGLVKLWTSAGVFVRQFAGHTGYAYGVRFAPNGQRIVSCGMDDVLRVWNAGTGALERTITGHTSDVRAVDISPNGTYIVSAAVDQTVRIWELATGTQAMQLTALGSGFFFSVACSPTDNRIVAGALNNMVALWSVPLVGVPVVRIAPRMYLEGPYNNATGRMNATLLQGGLLPAMEPYTGLGYGHTGGGGGESTTAAVLGITGSNAMIDWVVVELRSAANPAVVVASRSALLRANGDVVAPVDGTSAVSFNVGPGNYVVSVRHRNHLGIMTASSVALSSSAATVDLSNGSVALAGGTDATKLVGTRRVLYAGDPTRDGVLRYTGANNDRDLVLARVGGVVPTVVTTGYFVEDLNLDGVVRYTGANNDRDIILTNIGGVIPTSTRVDFIP